MKKYFLVILFLSAAGFLFSCKDDYTICTLSKDVKFTTGFYRRVAGADVAFTAPSFSLSVLNGSASVYSAQPNQGSFSIPLNPVEDSAKYLITVSGTSPADTLTIVYTTQSTNLSAECGSVQYNAVTAFRSTKHTIDSVKIVQPSVTNTPRENARIYF